MRLELDKIKRKHDSAIILGSGPSVNKFEQKHLNWLSTVDKWALNNFIIHDFIVPDFYFSEIKPTINGKILDKLFEEKKELYKDTIFFVKRAAVKTILNTTGKYLNGKDFKTCVYTPNPKAVAAAGCSLAYMLSVLRQFNYKRLYFMGVDLYTSEYFWTDNPRYDHLDTATIYYNYCTQKKGLVNYNDKKTNPHLTGKKVVPFIKKFIETNKIDAINLSEKSSLNQIMRTEDIPQ